MRLFCSMKTVNDYGELIDVDNRDPEKIRISLEFKNEKNPMHFVLNVAYGVILFLDESKTDDGLESIINKINALIADGAFADKILERKVKDEQEKARIEAEKKREQLELERKIKRLEEENRIKQLELEEKRKKLEEEIIRKEQERIRYEIMGIFLDLDVKYKFLGPIYKTTIESLELFAKKGEITVDDYTDLNFCYNQLDLINNKNKNEVFLQIELNKEIKDNAIIYDRDPNDTNSKFTSFKDYSIDKDSDLKIDWDTIFYNGILPTDYDCMNNKELFKAKEEFIRIKKACLRVKNNIPINCIKSIIFLSEKELDDFKSDYIYENFKNIKLVTVSNFYEISEVYKDKMKQRTAIEEQFDLCF